MLWGIAVFHGNIQMQRKCLSWIIRIRAFLPWARLAAKPVPGPFLLGRTSHRLLALPQDWLSDPVSLWGKVFLFYPKIIALSSATVFLHTPLDCLAQSSLQKLGAICEVSPVAPLSFPIAPPVSKVINSRKLTDLSKALDSLCEMTWFGV